MTTSHDAETRRADEVFEVEALLFDIDGTLVDSTPFVDRLWRVWGREVGVDPAEIFAVAHGRRSRDVMAHFFSGDDLDAAAGAYERLKAAQLDDSDALPGTRELLPALPSERWAAVTSGRRHSMVPRMLRAGLPLPRVLVTAEDVPRGKPDPAGYLLAAAQLGIAPERCAVFEDAASGVAAGRAAGAVTVGVGTSGALHRLGDATLRVADLTRLRIEVGASSIRISVAP